MKEHFADSDNASVNHDPQGTALLKSWHEGPYTNYVAFTHHTISCWLRIAQQSLIGTLVGGVPRGT